MSLNPIVALSEQFQKLINEHGSAAILRDNLTFFKSQIEALEKQVIQLQTENTDLKSQLAKHLSNNPTNASLGDFVEHRGAFFKKIPGNGYALSVYCPRCKTSTFAHDGSDPFYCIKCKWVADFTKNQLAYIMQGLPPSDKL